MERGHKYLIEGRYYNVNGYATAIVACVTHKVDWAAYMGGAPGSQTEAETLKFVASRGAKLSEEDARHFFPEVQEPYRL